MLYRMYRIYKKYKYSLWNSYNFQHRHKTEIGRLINKNKSETFFWSLTRLFEFYFAFI